ncbi:T-cell surface glycoprotein CD3 delta chain-like isoform X1 [Hypanus sabinus]|uniref:T-cell surface glycoprotein CD3 delta chain-like isoform X1 n=1 Tax=Hypanus sabinus TaxID=79690 RepID=UPI0028C49A91|nr:T-cell surface glycoprotein CD3 delta chain-like isoform X1 [Hypanus sabinus]
MQFSKILVFIVVGAAFLLFGVSEAKINITSSGDSLRMSCMNQNVTFKKSENEPVTIVTSCPLTIWKVTEADSGIYECHQESEPTFLFIKDCINCIQVDPGTLAGIVIGDLVATFLIAVAVYCVSTPPKLKLYQAADRLALVKNDAAAALYAGLRKEDRAEYSRLKTKATQ